VKKVSCWRSPPGCSQGDLRRIRKPRRDQHSRVAGFQSKNRTAERPYFPQFRQRRRYLCDPSTTKLSVGAIVASCALAHELSPLPAQLPAIFFFHLVPRKSPQKSALDVTKEPQLGKIAKYKSCRPIRKTLAESESRCVCPSVLLCNLATALLCHHQPLFGDFWGQDEQKNIAGSCAGGAEFVRPRPRATIAPTDIWSWTGSQRYRRRWQKLREGMRRSAVRILVDWNPQRAKF